VLCPITLGNWMFEAITSLTRVMTAVPPPQETAEPKRAVMETHPQCRSSIHIESIPRTPSTAYTLATRRLSLQFTPISPAFTAHSLSLVEDDETIEEEKAALKRSASKAMMRRRAIETRPRARWDDGRLARLTTVKVEKPQETNSSPGAQHQSIWSLIRDVYPTIPHKPAVLFGVCICLLSGAMTPLFSFLLSRLMFEVSIGAGHVHTINVFGGIVLAMTAIDGLLMGAKYFVMETSAARWLERIRITGFTLVLAQDKQWFDHSENASSRIVQVLVKDGDDARNLIAVVLGQFCVVTAMIGVGLIWALVYGWQLTLVGFAIAPVFAATMAVQTNLATRCEARNKRAGEEVTKVYYEVGIMILVMLCC
jgi:ATP-binding cassette subfamily B (MDR/TAP) protein 1